MTRLLASLALAACLLVPHAAFAQTPPPAPKAAKSTAAPKISKDQKVCRYRFPTGKQETWVCQRDQPCCAWDAINYVKCGSTITGCL